MRKGVFVLFVTLAAVIAAMPVARAQTAVPVVVLDGRGFGHGVGLAQWGAKYLADAGARHEDILAKFYPGTELSTASGTVRVAVYTSPDNRSTLSFPSGGEVRSSPSGDQAPGFPVQVGPGGSVAVTYDGSYHVTPLVTAQAVGQPVIWQGSASSSQVCGIPFTPACPPTTTAPPNNGGGGGCVVLCTPTTPPPTTVPPDTTTPPETGPPPPSDPGGPGGGGGSTTASSGAPVWAVPNGTTGVEERGRHYRGLIEATAGGGPLRLVNQLDVETYLKGMGEVPSNWPLEAIAAQSVVARTYALRAMSFSGELCDYDLCQVYIGADREAAGQNEAVDATQGQVVTYGGGLATTVYSADAGGITATPLEGFGSDTNYAYLQVVRYDTPDPLPWRAEVALSDVASRFAYPGSVTDVKIGQAGPSGRALQVTLDGSAGPVAVDGRRFAANLGLRSTLFQPTITTSDNVPALPPLGDSAMQVLPEDATAIKQAALTGDASRGAPNIAALHDWGSKLTSSLSRSAHGATDLASKPATWIAITLAVMGMAYAFARGDTPSPLAMQLVDGLRFPMLRWPADGREITSPLARPQSMLQPPSRPRRTRPLRVRKKS
ncbi:MAG: stage sporulation protein [Acidimicrobiaceae bacterium]